MTALSPTLLGAAGAMISTARDVARFFRALLSGRLLAPAQLRAMKTIDPVATGGIRDSGLRGGGWGLGLLRERFPCGTAWGHDNEIPATRPRRGTVRTAGGRSWWSPTAS